MSLHQQMHFGYFMVDDDDLLCRRSSSLLPRKATRLETAFRADQTQSLTFTSHCQDVLEVHVRSPWRRSMNKILHGNKEAQSWIILTDWNALKKLMIKMLMQVSAFPSLFLGVHPPWSWPPIGWSNLRFHAQLVHVFPSIKFMFFH